MVQAANSRNMKEYSIEQAWDALVDQGVATEAELQLVTTINGQSMESLESVLFARVGYRSFEQMEEMQS